MAQEPFHVLDQQQFVDAMRRALDTQLPQRARLDALHRMSIGILVHPLDLHGVFDKALADCLALTESAFGFIGLNNEDLSAMDVVAIQGFRPSPDFFRRYHHIPLRPNVFSQAARDATPVISDDVLHDPRRVGQPRGHPPVRTFLGIPLRVIGKPIGMIGVANRLGQYDGEDELLLSAYASQVALAIFKASPFEELRLSKADLEAETVQRIATLELTSQELTRRAEQLQMLVVETLAIQERERERIAHDMHDGMTQLIIGATFELKAASERLAAHDEAGAARAHRQIRSVLQQVDHELRRIIFELRPPSLDDLGLAESVGRYVARFRGYTGIPTVAQIQGEPLRLPLEVEIGLYRIMQEALNNVAQHAAASAARVQLDFAAEAVTLTVVDDGRGFDTQAVRDNQRLGLVGMAERASRVGGKLRVDSHPGGGTTVTVRVPLESAMADR